MRWPLVPVGEVRHWRVPAFTDLESKILWKQMQITVIIVHLWSSKMVSDEIEGEQL